MTSELAWFKSSYSGSAGGECLEVALEWHKSTHSGSEGGECVEVASCPGTVHVRDSKDPQGPTLAFGPAPWSAFTAYAANR
ncbi:DUF397 domain-containing protein [Streptomyces sp. NPDC059373]